MEKKQMMLPTPEGKIEVFLDAGFFENLDIPSPIHEHKYTEIHFVERGFVTLFAKKGEYHLTAGDLIAIPAGLTHTSHDAKGTVHRAFQLNYPVDKVMTAHFPHTVFSELIDEADEYIKVGSSKSISKYIVFLTKDILTPEPEISNVEDRRFVVHDFFENNYHRQITIEDLAERLNLSPKQTQRLVQSYTGNTFGKELTRVRIKAARLLIKDNEQLSLLEISHRVGYRSYSGFWKAFKTVR